MRVPSDVPLRCRCGHVRGVASKVGPSSGFRLVCYCKDCQAFARFLGRPDVLDAAGGTDIFQMPTSRVKLTAGTDVLQCLCLSAKIFRWYADCCKTPVGNTAGPGFPVVGLIHCFMDHEGNGHFLDQVLGPPLCSIYRQSAIGPLPTNAAAPPSFRVLIRLMSDRLGWWVRGLGRPNPFFDDDTKAPRASPRLLAPDEREALNTSA
jgi:hypothetical protein